MTILYAGRRTFSESANKRGICEVRSADKKNLPSILIDESKAEKFDWGRHGRLSANLARSILVHYFNKTDSDDIYFNEIVQKFYEEVVLNLPTDAWQIEEDDLKAYLTRVVKETYGEYLNEEN